MPTKVPWFMYLFNKGPTASVSILASGSGRLIDTSRTITVIPINVSYNCNSEYLEKALKPPRAAVSLPETLT